MIYSWHDITQKHMGICFLDSGKAQTLKKYLTGDWNNQL